MIMSRDTFLAQLIRQSDNEQVSFFAEYKLSEILPTVCAYLNTDGGWIIIGHSGKIVSGLDRVNVKAEEIKNQIAEKIVPQPLVYVQDEVLQNKDLILINVLKGTRQPYSFTGKIYIRKGNKSMVASPDDISLLLRKPDKFASTW